MLQFSYELKSYCREIFQIMTSEYIANLKINQYGGSFISCPSSWSGSHVAAPYHKLYFPVSGEAQITAKGHSYLLKKNQLMLIPKNVVHSFSLTDACHLEKYWLHFTTHSEGIDLFSQFHDITIWDFTDSDDCKKLVGCFHQLFTKKSSNALELSLLQHASLYQICAILFAHSPEKIPVTLQNTPRHSKQAVILKYIDDHLADPLTVKQLSDVLFMHPTAFIRYFKNRMGMPPLKYIKYLRLERAKLYLETTDYTIQEIAALTGFTTTSHFSREFKSTYGMTPVQDRKTLY